MTCLWTEERPVALPTEDDISAVRVTASFARASSADEAGRAAAGSAAGGRIGAARPLRLYRSFSARARSALGRGQLAAAGIVGIEPALVGGSDPLRHRLGSAGARRTIADGALARRGVIREPEYGHQGLHGAGTRRCALHATRAGGVCSRHTSAAGQTRTPRTAAGAFTGCPLAGRAGRGSWGRRAPSPVRAARAFRTARPCRAGGCRRVSRPRPGGRGSGRRRGCRISAGRTTPAAGSSVARCRCGLRFGWLVAD